MGIVNDGRSGMALLLVTGSAAPPTVFNIGYGSGTFLVTQSGLITQHSTLTRSFTTIDASTIRQVTYTGNWTTTELSGLYLTEFGISKSGGNIWNRESFGSIAFNGTQELEIQLTYEVF